MRTIVVILITCLILTLLRRTVLSRRNSRIAKRTGFPVVISPVDITEIWWLLLYRRLLPLLDVFPKAWTASWLPFVQRFHLWKLGHQPFERIGSDTIVISSPRGNHLQTCDPVVANQILTQHTAIKMNLEVTKIFDIWGPTVGSTEGQEWRAHRRIVAAGLGPQTNALVWDQAVKDTEELLNQWKQRNSVLEHVKPWTSKLALHIISAIFFERELPWTKEQHAQVLGPQHRLTFEQALTTIVSKIRVIFMIPRPVLNRLPMKFAKDVCLAISEWTTYMKEMRRDMSERATKRPATLRRTGASLLENIVVGFADLSADEKEQLPEDYALGNIFFTLLAGHETIGNTLAFIILLLCVYPEWQDRLQQQIDGQRPNSETYTAEQQQPWRYHDNHSRLQEGPMAAFIHETLRVYNVVQMVWRRVAAPTSVTDSAGEVHELIPGMLCMINFCAAHRNPAKWPPREDCSSTRRAELNHSPALDFDPGRWLGDINPAVDSSQERKTPTWWPFSQGVRSCPGRGFAMVEMTAVLSTVLKDHSLQLHFDGGVPCSVARNDALRKLVDGVHANLNIEMVAKLPVRVLSRRQTS